MLFSYSTKRSASTLDASEDNHEEDLFDSSKKKRTSSKKTKVAPKPAKTKVVVKHNDQGDARKKAAAKLVEEEDAVGSMQDLADYANKALDEMPKGSSGGGKQNTKKGTMRQQHKQQHHHDQERHPQPQHPHPLHHHQPQSQLLPPQEPHSPIKYPFPPGEVDLEENLPTAIQKRWIIQEIERMQAKKKTEYSKALAQKLARKLNCKSEYIDKLMQLYHRNTQHQFKDDKPKALDNLSEASILKKLQQRAGELNKADVIALLHQEHQATIKRRDPKSRVQKMKSFKIQRYLRKLCPEMLQKDDQPRHQNKQVPRTDVEDITFPIPTIHPVFPLSIPGGVSSSSSSRSSSAKAIAVHAAALDAMAMEAHQHVANAIAANQYALAQAYDQQADSCVW